MELAFSLKKDEMDSGIKTAPLLQVQDLKVWFPVSTGFSFGFRRKREYVRAVDGVSFNVNEGDVFSIVGESGAGKTTLGLAIVGLYKPTEGRILFRGIDINNADKKQMKYLRRKIQMIFQDPFESLPPHMRIFDIVGEGIDVHKLAGSPREKTEIIKQALEAVGLTPAEKFFDKYPYQLSGGQRQRVSIASTIVLQPDIIIADEPVSMIDASLRWGIIELLMELKHKLKLTYIFILHDLALTRYISNYTAVMYLGQIVELGPSIEVIEKPMNPYTQALISVVPSLRKEKKSKIILKGEIPNPVNVPSGCRFHPRCPLVFEKCYQEEPQLVEVNPNHFVRCLLYS